MSNVTKLSHWLDNGTELVPKNARATRFDTGVAVTAASYWFGRDSDGTNQLHFNVPTGATFEFSFNDAPHILGVPGGWRFPIGAGAAITAGQFEIKLDVDPVPQMHFNVPTASSFEFSVNDVSQVVISRISDSRDSIISANGISTTVAGDSIGASFSVTANPTGANANNYIGSQGTVATSGMGAFAVSGEVIGYLGSIILDGNAGSSFTLAVSGSSGFVNVNAGTSTMTAGAAGQINRGAGNSTTSAALWARAYTSTGAGTFTTTYGLLVDPPGLGSTAWTAAIGTGNSYIAGSLAIGKTTAPTAALDVASINSLNATSSSITLQNQTFTAGATHNAVAISPTWATENQAHTGLALTATQNGANTISLTGLSVAMVKATGATTLATMNGISFAAPSVAGTVTASNVLSIANQTNAGITTPRGINFAATGVANSIVWGGSIQFGVSAEVLGFRDSTNARGINFTFTAGGVQSIATTAGNLEFTNGAAFSSGGTVLANYTESTFTPTVTLVGGAGNVVPVYSTNTGRHTRIGNRVYVDVLLTGDGGDEGAGTGQINIALPVAAGASHPAGEFTIGTAINNLSSYILTGTISGGSTTVALSYFNLISTEASFTGADQNNATRTIRLKFFYEV